MAKKRKRSRPGKRHRILFVRHSLNRVWRNLLFADLIVWVVWWAAPYARWEFQPPRDQYLFYAGIIILVIMLGVFLLRNRGFVQVRDQHVLLAMPLFRTRLPYANIENVRMMQYGDGQDQTKQGWSVRRFMKPYRGKTMTALYMKSYPRSKGLLRLMLPSYLWLPKRDGFLLYLEDYVGFNTEVDSKLNLARGLTAEMPSVERAADDVYDGYFDQLDA